METPVLIIGSGLAGLSAVYQMIQQGVPCTLVTKSPKVLEGSNSVYAQGGIVYKAEQGDPEDLVEDVLNAGDHINFLEAVQQLAHEGVEYVQDVLINKAKTPFDQKNGRFHLTKEAAHQHPRILHVKDSTGKSIMSSLWALVKESPLVQVLEDHTLVDLLTSGHNCAGYEFKYRPNRCLGAFLYDSKSATVKMIKAQYTLLCTGGVGQLYEFHTNAEHAYGSGLAVANRAKVRVINARFIQFHPTALWTPHKGRRFLISEALRGEGARLMNKDGKYIMDEYPLKDLESRAVVSQVIMEELQQSQHEFVYLNLADHYKGSIPIKDRFPGIYEHCLQEGIDITSEPIPVVPAEHFSCGGIYVDLDGQTELEGLFAAGEVACSGVHGANRLASTSLLECLTWGTKAGQKISELYSSTTAQDQVVLDKAFSLLEEWQSFGSEICNEQDVEIEKDRMRKIMWDCVGILRTKERLLEAKDALRQLWKEIDAKYASYALSEPLIELRHMIEAAYLITVSASSHTSLKEDNLGGHVLVEGE